jgi:hypothetical protein
MNLIYFTSQALRSDLIIYLPVEARIAAVESGKLLFLHIWDEVLVFVAIIIIAILLGCAHPCALRSRLNSSVTSSLTLSPLPFLFSKKVLNSVEVFVLSNASLHKCLFSIPLRFIRHI